MKLKIIPIITVCFVMVSATPLFAEENPCADVVPISVIAGTRGVTAAIQTILNNYRDYVHDGNYLLCFPPTEFKIDGTLHIPNDSEQGVLIAGLNVTAKDTFSSSEQALLKIEGERIKLSDSVITCTRSDQIGLNISGPNNTVQGTEISSCSEGVRISASNTLLGASDSAHYSEEKNVIHDNTVGIHQVSGSGNKWPYNSVCHGDGIVVDGGVRPVLHVGEGLVADLRCQREGERVTQCALQVDSAPEAAGEMEIYKTNRTACGSQGYEYTAKCAISGADCVLDSANAGALISQIMCDEGIRCKFIALFTGANSTMYTSEPFSVFPTDIGTIVMAPETGPIFAPQGVGSDSGDGGIDEIDDNTERISDGNGMTAGAGGGSIDTASVPEAAGASAAGARCGLVAGAPRTVRMLEIFPVLFLLSILGVRRFTMFCKGEIER